MARSRQNLNDSIGQRVCLAFNKVGTLRYYGNINSAPGNWCGIELDDPDGNNDGSIDGIHYFTCEENHGLFFQVSEILTDCVILCKCIIPSESTDLTWLLPEDPNLALNNENCNEAPASGTSSNVSLVPVDYILDFYSTDSVVDLRLYQEKISPTKFENVEFGSDESLGILPLSALEDESISLSDISFDISMHSESEHVTPALIKETTHCISRVLHSFEDQENLNITQTLNSPVVQNNVNETHSLLHNRTFQVEELKEIENNYNTDNLSSLVPKIIPDSKSDKSSVRKTPSSPKYSSTPKHEVNYTFILDEEFLNSEKEKEFSPVGNFNKTITKDVIKKTVFPESDEFDNENMQNIDKSIDYQCEFDKTSNNVYTDTKYLPSVAAALNTTVTFPEKPNRTFEIETNEMHEIAASDSCHVKNDKNILNATVCLSKKFVMLNLEERLDCNKSVSDSSLEKNAEYGDFKEISGNTLNTPQIPKVLEKEKSHHYKTQILNNTFEKLDQLAELPKLMNAPQVQRDVIKGTRIAKLSKIVKKADNSSAAASCSKYTKPDKTRKSVFSTRSNSTDALNKQKSRRKTLGSISTQSDDNIVSSQKLSICAEKQCFASDATSGPQSLKTEASLCNISKKYPVKRDTASLPATRKIVSPYMKKSIAPAPVKKSIAPAPVKNNVASPPVKTDVATLPVKKNTFRKSTAEISSHASFSMYDTSKSREAKSSVVKKFKNSRLNETINLDLSILDDEITPFKMPNIPYKKRSPIPEVPRIPEPVRRKSSLPVFIRSSSTVAHAEHKLSVSGSSDKKVLSQRNISDACGDPGSSSQNRRQSLRIKSDPNRLVPPSQNKTAAKNVPPLTNRPSSISSQSNIPTAVNKKKGPEDKAMTGAIPKRKSVYNLR